jgi:hypothetical protein
MTRLLGFFAAATLAALGCSTLHGAPSSSESDSTENVANDAGRDASEGEPATDADTPEAAPEDDATPIDAGADASASQSGTPGTYANWSWPADVQQLTDEDFFVTVNVDPGPTSDVFFSNQFDVSDTLGGYTGMQTNVENGGRLFLFSVWGATSSKTGSPGTFCVPFTEGTSGISCRMWSPWVVGHTYKFHLSALGGGWLNVTVSDTSGTDSFDLGSLQVDSSIDALPPHGISQWTEYFEWSDPRATCRSVPFSSVSFRLQGNGGTVAATSSGTETSKTCTPYSSSVVDNGTATEKNGIGNSLRAQVRADGGLCLNAEGGIQDGANAILYPCGSPAGRNEAWVIADDGSLRLEGNYCLTAGGANLTVATCVEGNAQQRWTVLGDRLVSSSSGACMASGAVPTADGNTPLVLASCDQAPTYTLPPFP